MADENRQVKWYYIYAREIKGETYYLCDEERPIRPAAYQPMVHPVKNAYEYVGALQNRYGSTFETFVQSEPGQMVLHQSGDAYIVGGWRLEE